MNLWLYAVWHVFSVSLAAIDLRLEQMEEVVTGKNMCTPNWMAV
jgi:hypothetical protein